MNEETPDVNSMTYHAQLEKLKRLILEAIRDVELDPDAFEEEDINLLLEYVDNLCQKLAEMDEVLNSESDEEREALKAAFLLKAIIANAAVVILQKKKLVD